jgi:putative glutamine amidotransferase
VTFAGQRYLDALLRAGGEPFVVTPRQLTADAAQEVMSTCDALLLIGGPDVDPALYGHEPHSRTYGVNALQDQFEIALLRAAMLLNKPVLAVCRGIQLVNVALGGTLHQHIDDDTTVAHKPVNFPDGDEFAIHSVRIAEGSQVHRVVGATNIDVASFHHQAIDELGAELTAVAWSSDGFIEAVEHNTSWLLAVQWHPEDTAAHDPYAQALYDAVVGAVKSPSIAQRNVRVITSPNG